MWLFFTRRLRMWLILTVVVPLATTVLRRLGVFLQRRGAPPVVVNALLKGSRLGEQARVKLGGRLRRR